MVVVVVVVVLIDSDFPQWSFHIGLGGVPQKMHLEVKTGKIKF